jgi:hypothetical protein
MRIEIPQLFALLPICISALRIATKKEVSLAHMVRKVDVQPSHLGLSPHGCRFGFLLLKKHCKGFPYRISFKKKG